MLGQTTNLIINLDRDDWILDDDSKLLVDVGFGEFQQPRNTFLLMCCRERNRGQLLQQGAVRSIQS